jgi:broad specificity phosphatase PhoE
MHLGVLERVSFTDAHARHPELVTRGYHSMLSFRMPGGGESVQDVADRALPCVQQLIASHLAAPGEPTPAVAIVAHNTVNRVLLACAAGLGPSAFIRFEQTLGAISRIDFFAPCDPADPWAAARLGLCNYVPGADP